MMSVSAGINRTVVETDRSATSAVDNVTELLSEDISYYLSYFNTACTRRNLLKFWVIWLETLRGNTTNTAKEIKMKIITKSEIVVQYMEQIVKRLC
jgi:hypothetical protein